MRKIIPILIIFTSFSWAGSYENKIYRSYNDYLDERTIDGKNLVVNPERFHRFIENLTNSQVVIINVKGMVCDFCARGIEKTFKKDDKVKKIDIDLTKGKVLLAYSLEEIIDFADVNQNILINGQNAVDMNIITLNNNER